MVVRPAAVSVLLAVALVPAGWGAPPPDAFCVILFSADDSFSTVTVLVDLETNLTERQALFGQLDLDHDGDVDLLEQERLRSSTVRQHDSSSSLGIKALSLAAGDGQQQWGAAFVAAKTWTQVGHTFHKQSHTTPALITDPADLETQEVRELHFDHLGTPTVVQISGGTDPNAPPPTSSASPTTSSSTSGQTTVAIEYVVVRAPEGWTVYTAEGWSYEAPVRTAPQSREADLPQFDTKRPFTLGFAKLPQVTGTTTGPATDDPVSTSATGTGRVVGEPEPDAGRGAAAVPATLLVAGLGLALLARRRL